MHTKTIVALLLSASAFVAAEELEKKQYYSDSDSYYNSYYNSLMSDLNSLASETDYLDWYDDMPTDYSQYVPSDPTDYSQYAPSNPTGSGNSGNSDNSDNSDNSNNAVMTDAPSMPSGPAVDIPPPSIQSVLITAVPASYLSQMANPSARSSLINEIQHGNYPSWYDDLPGNVKSWIHDHYASATGFGASPTDGAGSDSGPHGPVPGAAPPSGVIATGLLGAAGILAAAVML